MNDRYLYILLNIVKNNSDIKKLTREGVDFKEIAELTKDAIKHNFLEYRDDSITISELGKLKIIELDDRFKVINKNNWIEKENMSKIPRLEKDFIFLPNQNEIHF